MACSPRATFKGSACHERGPKSARLAKQAAGALCVGAGSSVRFVRYPVEMTDGCSEQVFQAGDRPADPRYLAAFYYNAFQRSDSKDAVRAA